MNIINWIKAHKKLALTIAAGVFLLIALIFIISQTVKEKFFPVNPDAPNFTGINDLKGSAASIELQIPKQTYALNEKVPVSVIASSDSKTTRGFDVVIEYDPEMVSLNYKNVPQIPDFLYFEKTTDTILRISGVQKADSNKNLIFDKSTLTEFEVTPIKAGKTTLKLIYSPSSTHDSNLLDQTSMDFLGRAQGAEIEIK